MEEMKWSSSVFLIGVLTANILCFVFALAECRTAFWPATVPRGHGNGMITHWTHMEEMKWSSSVFLWQMRLQTSFVLAWLWLKSAKLTFGQQQCQEDMACPKSAMQCLHNMVTSLIGLIWRK
jgi:hypothetical protein